MPIQPVVLHVATDLGLRPSGVRRLGTVVLELGLLERLGAASAGQLEAGGFDDEIDPDSGARNVRAVAKLARIQADHVGRILADGGFPVVLGATTRSCSALCSHCADGARPGS